MSFASQRIGVAVIAVWTVAATGFVFGVLKLAGQARVSTEHECEGLDGTEHGVDTYPEFGRPDVADGGSALRTDGSGHLRADGVVDLPNDGERTEGPRSSSELRSDGGGIKLVTAIIRPDRLSEVKTALAQVGAPILTVTNVSGRGSQPAKTGQWRGEEYAVDLHLLVKVECAVADVPADEVVEAADTGEPGDGKIFVVPVEDACQVRTGVRGTGAV